MKSQIFISLKNFSVFSYKYILQLLWQFPQIVVGVIFLQLLKIFVGIQKVGYYKGTMVFETNKEKWGGMSFGKCIVGQKGIKAYPDDPLFQHEYGHYIQSRKLGWYYLSKIGIPSLLSNNSKPHNDHPVEQDANARAYEYFSKTVKGFNYKDKQGSYITKWSKNYNAINGYNWELHFSEDTNTKVRSNCVLKLLWYDYLIYPLNFLLIGIVISGLLNAIILNRRY